MLFTLRLTCWKTQTNNGMVLGNSFTFLMGHSYFISCYSMHELKYLIYCLFKSIHVGICVFPQTLHQVKATMIFADRALWRHKASNGSGFPHCHSSVGNCCRRGMHTVWQSCGCSTPLYLQRGSCRVVELTTTCLSARLVSQEGFVARMLSGCCWRCLRMRLRVTAWAELTAANIKKKSCCRQCASAPHSVLSVVSSDPQAKQFGSGDWQMPMGKKTNNFFGWVNMLAAPCVNPWTWAEGGGEGEAGPSCFDGGKLLVQLHCNMEVHP